MHKVTAHIYITNTTKLTKNTNHLLKKNEVMPNVLKNLISPCEIVLIL